MYLLVQLVLVHILKASFPVSTDFFRRLAFQVGQLRFCLYRIVAGVSPFVKQHVRIL